MDIKNKIETKSDFPLFAGSTTDIIYIDEPLLTLGKNRLGLPVISMLVDEEGNTKQYVSAVLQDSDISNYFLKKSSLYSLMKEQSILYMLNFDISEKKHQIYEVEPKDIPDEYYPEEDSFYPYSKTLSFSSSFKLEIHGGTANRHLVLPQDSISAQKNFGDAIKNILSFLDFGGVKYYSAPDTSGSYEINFALEPVGDGGQISLNNNFEAIVEVINKILRYSWDDLLNEINQLIQDESNNHPIFDEIHNQLILLYKSLGREDIGLKENLLKILYEITLNNSQICQLLSNGYDTIKINSYNSNKDNSEFNLANLDGNLKLRVENTKVLFENSLITKDNTKKSYSIEIYDLNKETGNGWAKVQNSINGKTFIDRTRIHINQDINLNDSIFTRSFSSSETITIQGKATKIRNHIAQLTIYE